MFFSGLGLGFNRVKNTIIIIFYCNIFIQKKNMGACNNSSVAHTVGREQESEAKKF